MSWKDFKVRTKIIICFMPPLILMGIIGVWTFQYSKMISTNATHLRDESVVFAGIANQMDKDVIQIQQWLTDISATRGLDGLDDGFDEAEKSYQSLLSGLKRFDKMFKEENDSAAIKKTQELKVNVDNYYEIGKKMAKAYIKGGPEVGNKMMADFDEVAERLSSVLVPFVEEQVKEEEEKAGDIIELVNNLKTTVMIIFFLSVAITILSGIFLTRTVKRPLYKAMELAHSLAEGDLTKQADLNQKDEFGQLLVAMKTMAGDLKRIVGNIIGVAGAVASGSEEVSATTTQITSGINEQAQQLEQSSTATTEVSQTIVDIARNATEASDVANESVATANKGKSVVEHTVTSMLNIAENVEKSSQTIGELGKSSEHIGEIINVINDIAGQTNLLALNAAIEAARAGEQGRGFAVVADEVRKLAEKTGQATDEITGMIKKIQQETEISVKSMEKNKIEAEEGVKLAGHAQISLDKIVMSSEKCLDMVRSIATATEQQSSAVEEVSTNIENISSFFMTSREAISQINESTNELAQISSELMTLVSWFKTDTNTGNIAAKNKYTGVSVTGSVDIDPGTHT